MSNRITATIYETHTEKLSQIKEQEGLDSDAEAIRWCIDRVAPDSKSASELENDLERVRAERDRLEDEVERQSEIAGEIARLNESQQRMEAKLPDDLDKPRGVLGKVRNRIG